MGRDRSDLLHILARRADVFGGDIEAAERFHGAAERAEQGDAIPFALGPPQHRLRSAERQPGERIFVTHAFGQPHGIGERVARVGIGPQPAPPGARSEEHTSELQSLMRISYAVFCLKQKTKQAPPVSLKKPKTHRTSYFMAVAGFL